MSVMPVDSLSVAPVHLQKYFLKISNFKSLAITKLFHHENQASPTVNYFRITCTLMFQIHHAVHPYPCL